MSAERLVKRPSVSRARQTDGGTNKLRRPMMRRAKKRIESLVHGTILMASGLHHLRSQQDAIL
jgi:hypothetical protein